MLFDLICCLQYMIVNVFINEECIMHIITILTVHQWQHRLQQGNPWGQKGTAFCKKCNLVRTKVIVCKLQPSIPNGLEIDWQPACASVRGGHVVLDITSLAPGFVPWYFRKNGVNLCCQRQTATALFKIQNPTLPSCGTHNTNGALLPVVPSVTDEVFTFGKIDPLLLDIPKHPTELFGKVTTPMGMKGTTLVLQG